MAVRSHTATPPASVTVVITTYNHAHYLGEALESVLAQTRMPESVIVVDDGSTDDPGSVVLQFPGVRLVRKENGGLASARNTGLRASTSEFIIFLDADDLLERRAIELGLKKFAEAPECAFVYGGHRHVSGDRSPLWGDRYDPPGDTPFLHLIQGNFIAMHGTVMYRRQVLLEAGGFDSKLRRCEDYDAYLRIARKYPIGGYADVVAAYRWHGSNMSAANSEMLKTALQVQKTHAMAAFDQPGVRSAYVRGRANWIRYYANEMVEAARRQRREGGGVTKLLITYAQLAGVAPRRVWREALRSLKRRLKKRIPPGIVTAARRLRVHGTPPPGSVRFGDLDRVTPISDDFGYNRGKPIDRYYIEQFLSANANHVQGRVLEIGDDSYSQQFGGGRITEQDVLHVHSGNPLATIVGDVAAPGVLPEGRFDCIIFTQTLHLIYDFGSALDQLHKALKPGGSLLLTVPGISQIDRGEWGSTWFWAFTPAAMRRLVSERFGADALELTQFGNVFAATAFLHGMAAEEVDVRKLDYRDEAYPVISAIRAEKRG